MRRRSLPLLPLLALAATPLSAETLRDALAQAQASLGLPPAVEPWSIWVRLLRWLGSGGKAPRQEIPSQTSPSR